MSSAAPRRIVAVALGATGAASLAIGIAGAVPSSVSPRGEGAGPALADVPAEPAERSFSVDETGILRR